MVSPLTVAVKAPLDHVAVAPPGVAVTVYPVIAESPSDAGAFHVTVACVSPAVAVTLVGAPGVVAGVTAMDAEEAGLLPLAFVAVTVNV